MAKPDSNTDNGVTARVDAQARSWVVYLHSGDATPEKLAEFETWLAAEESHARAYRDFEQILEDIGLPCEMVGFDVTEHPEPVSVRKRVGFPGRAIAAGAIAAAAVLALSITAGTKFRPGPSLPAQVVEQPVIETQIAEIRDVTLPDGSVVTLGAKSRIDYRFEDDLRMVVLKEGEAFFDVAHDKSRPFYVQVGDRLVRVVGTRFDVRQSSDSVVVSVVEGVVEVIKGDNPEATEKERANIRKDVLTAGDKVTATIGREHRQIEEVDPAKAAAWRNGWLIYENVRLEDIIADVHRYDARRFVFSDDDLKSLHVTAAFGADKVDQFLDALEASYPLLVDESNPSEVVFRPAS